MLPATSALLLDLDDTLGFGKPDPRAFHHACALLAASPNETAYVGDHLEIDAIAAKHAGLQAVWLDRDPGDGDGDASGSGERTVDGAGASVARAHDIPVVTSLKELVALLVGD